MPTGDTVIGDVITGDGLQSDFLVQAKLDLTVELTTTLEMDVKL